ncbi:hypothetical protein [Aquitalea magnusonii]|uniref:hypothetical protein n=1 Tax=Aquitalea magnusonii TaxID=332411 RepID=UPI000B5C7ACF|nr:hypothetical protein [Aquitalea magnusonii]
MKAVWLVVLLVAIWLLLYRIAKRRRARQLRATLRSKGFIVATPSSQGQGGAGFSKLVSACMGDSARATRLVQEAQRNNPSLSYRQAVMAAMDHLSSQRSD